VADAFDEAEVAAVIAALDPFAAASEAFLRGRPDGRLSIARAGEISFSPHLVARSEVLRGFSRHPLLLALARDLLGDDARLYWDQAVYKADTDQDFPWHQDNGYTYVEPQQYLTCWVALTDATVDNGCPWILPGVHRLGTLTHDWTELGFCCYDGTPREAGALQRLLEQHGLPDAVTPRPLELAAGSVAVFSSLTPHRTGPNRTGQVRKSYILQYAPDGAVMYPMDSAPHPADNADWQYPVLRAGVPA
jgi:ectoine hydroxylase-related dioxygenase (phytanoyl-CoA dioxygenase family)